ncbi:MAG: hypothetical protein ACM3QS_14360 [Bacteroidota bacterium]
MSESPMPETPMSPEVTSDDKLWAALGYPIPLIAVIVLLMEDKKNRPFIKFHAVQSIALWVVYVVLGTIITTITFGIGGICFAVAWLVFLYWAYLAYQGQLFEVPLVTNFLKNQGWV